MPMPKREKGELLFIPSSTPCRNVKEKILRHIEVQFQNEGHAFVDDYLLEDLIRSRQINLTR